MIAGEHFRPAELSDGPAGMTFSRSTIDKNPIVLGRWAAHNQTRHPGYA